jgi:hypothetical protein
MKAKSVCAEETDAGEHDTLLTGYSESQLEWCQKNERRHGLFYRPKAPFCHRTEPGHEIRKRRTYDRRISERIARKPGQWIGYRIVKAYMEKQPSNLMALMNENDYKKILHDSGYKPE